MTELFEIVHEDDQLLVINKPAGLVCHPTKSGPLSSLISRVRIHLGDAIRPQLINRLDRETSGLVFVARNPEAALELRRCWESGKVDKRYLAVVHGRLDRSSMMIDAPLGKDDRSAVAIKDCVRADGAPSRTEIRRLHTFSRNDQDFSLVEVRPQSGRKHQIRIHLASVGHPIVGDKLYGPDEQYYLDFVVGRLSESASRVLQLTNHALHAFETTFPHKGGSIRFRARPEPAFREFIVGWDGDQLAARGCHALLAKREWSMREAKASQ